LSSAANFRRLPLPCAAPTAGGVGAAFALLVAGRWRRSRRRPWSHRRHPARRPPQRRRVPARRHRLSAQRRRRRRC